TPALIQSLNGASATIATNQSVSRSAAQAEFPCHVFNRPDWQAIRVAAEQITDCLLAAAGLRPGRIILGDVVRHRPLSLLQRCCPEFSHLRQQEQGNSHLYGNRKQLFSLILPPHQLPQHDTRRDGFAAILLRSDPGFLPLLNAVNALSPVTQWDPLPFDLQTLTSGAVAFVVDLAATVTSQRAAVTQRSAAVQTQLNVAAAAAPGPAQVDALVAAAKALLGDDTIVI